MFIGMLLSPEISDWCGPGLTSMFQQLMLRFIPTDDGILTLQSFGIQLQNILHLADKGGIYFGQTPPLVQPRFEPPFFRQQRTVSAVIGSIYFSCTSLSAIICMVQQLRAAGGREPALAITYAPPLTPDFLDAPGRGFSFNGISSPY